MATAPALSFALPRAPALEPEFATEAAVALPRPKKDTKEKRALSAEAYRKLLAELDPTERMECAVLLCAALGLRRSESIALS